MRFEQLKVGEIIWDAHTYMMGSTRMRTMGLWPVKVIEIHQDRSITASWNGNRPARLAESRWKKFRVKRPELVHDSFGRAKIQLPPPARR